MRRPTLVLLGLLVGSTSSALPPTARPDSGIHRTDQDSGTRPRDDFYRFAVGGWIAHQKGPDYLPGWSAGRELQLDVYAKLRSELQRVATLPAEDAEQQKLADLYASYVDEPRIEALGLQPLAPTLAAIDAAADPEALARVMGQLVAVGIDMPLDLWVHPDDREPTRYLVDFAQGRLGLPDRDYYLSHEARFAGTLDAYRRYVERVLADAGSADAPAEAKAIVALETQLASAQWTEKANRVAGATSHRIARGDLARFAPGLDMAGFADAIGLADAATVVNISQPDYFAAVGRALGATPVATWRAYLRFRVISSLSLFLPRAYRESSSDFYGRTLSGSTTSRPRWLRGVGFVEDTMGDALGKLYVKRYFPPEAKRRATLVLDHVVAAFRQRIQALDWMNAQSRTEALAKLDQLVIRLGAPDRTRDYSALVTDRSDLIGNLTRARALEFRFQLDKVARTVDREEWSMSPQSVNGYYSVSRNQVVLPAALAQPPYFQNEADDAANYGGLGWFFAHELSHAFDSNGSHYDGHGLRREWMAQADRAEFERRAKRLVAQYHRYEVAPGLPLDGELSLGENIADVSGLAIAHAAYRTSLGGREAPVIDGLTGDQRFFLGFARIWAAAPMTDKDVNRALAETHAPPQFRVNGAVSNLDAFYAAFDVKAGDRMFIAPEDRVRLW